jgi:hypothetical protein
MNQTSGSKLNKETTWANRRQAKRPRPKGLSTHYQLIVPEIKEMYEKNNRSTEEIRRIFGIKSRPTLYKILEFSGVNIKKFFKNRKGEE